MFGLGHWNMYYWLCPRPMLVEVSLFSCLILYIEEHLEVYEQFESLVSSSLDSRQTPIPGWSSASLLYLKHGTDQFGSLWHAWMSTSGSSKLYFCLTSSIQWAEMALLPSCSSVLIMDWIQGFSFWQMRMRFGFPLIVSVLFHLGRLCIF